MFAIVTSKAVTRSQTRLQLAKESRNNRFDKSRMAYYQSSDTIKTPLENKNSDISKSPTNQRYGVKLPCTKDKCNKNCPQAFEPSERIKINENFWKMSPKNQQAFIARHVQMIKQPLRGMTAISYVLPKDNSTTTIPVCEKFFLATLGFKKPNPKIISEVLCKTTERANKLDPVTIEKHIKSCHPVQSAHRGDGDLPGTRYMLDNITMASLYKDFRKTHPDIKASYPLYRKVVKSLRIAFNYSPFTETPLWLALCPDYEDTDVKMDISGVKQTEDVFEDLFEDL